MDNVIDRKSQSQYLSLIVKKIIDDSLNNKEKERYAILKAGIDPLGSLEMELTQAWRLAEDMQKSEITNSFWFLKKDKKMFIRNIFREIKISKWIKLSLFHRVLTHAK